MLKYSCGITESNKYHFHGNSFDIDWLYCDKAAELFKVELLLGFYAFSLALDGCIQCLEDVTYNCIVFRPLRCTEIG